ncbi:hypothetical protein ACFLXU_00285, partial [Chloroflexota bacterium]
MIRFGKSTSILLVMVILLLVTFIPTIALADWSTSSTENNPVCNAANDQRYPQLVSDGSGGAIIVWEDDRSGDDIYAQRVDASGSTLWADNGTAICTTTGSQDQPQIVSDGSGGAIIVWYDYRSNSTYDVYAQRINDSGIAQWTDNGTAICTEIDDQEYPKLVPDASDGAIIVWQDYRNDNYDIYAQRVNASGIAQWTDNGTAICTAINDQSDMEIISDGSGGAIIAW